MSNIPKQLPDAPHHLLLPRAHVHFFAQVVVLVLGTASFLFGFFAFIVGLTKSDNSIYLRTLDTETTELLTFLGAGFFMGLGASVVLGWILWRFVMKSRFRFLVAFLASTVAIISALISVALQNDPAPVNYTFYFSMITFGVLTGLLSLFYFSHGLMRHVFGTHEKK